jgi:hypothetical protein
MISSLDSRTSARRHGISLGARTLGVWIAFLAGASSLQAQSSAGVSGTVTDPSGAALPGVAVTILSVDTGATRTIATDGGGRYQASGLPPGRIAIRAAKQGFTDESRTGISLAAARETTVDIQLQLAKPDACESGHEFATTDCSLTWHGITAYGAYDVGVGWVSHGLPENGVNYEGESLVNRNGYQHRFLIAPNNLQQTGLGIRGKEEFLPGWFVVFNVSTSSPTRQPPISPTTAFPGAAIL